MEGTWNYNGLYCYRRLEEYLILVRQEKENNRRGGLDREKCRIGKGEGNERLKVGGLSGAAARTGDLRKGKRIKIYKI